MPTPSAPSGCGFMYCSPTSVAVSWGIPENDGGAPITTYMLSLTPEGEPTTEHLIQAPQQAELVEGLIHGISVQAIVKASNDDGVSYGPECACPLIVPLAIPSVPPASAEAIALEPGTASISWTAPEVPPEGNAYYSVMSKSSNPSDPSVGLGTVNMEQVSCTLTGLNSQSEYSFTVEVVNQVGRSPAAVTNTIIFPLPPPPPEQPPSEEPPSEQPPSEGLPPEQPPSEEPPSEQPLPEQPPSEGLPPEQPPSEEPPPEGV